MEKSHDKITGTAPAQTAAPQEGGPKHEIHGFHVLTLSIIAMVVSIVLCVLLGYQTFEVASNFEVLDRITGDATLCEEAAARAERASDMLTNEARLYAVTGDTTHVRNYFKEASSDKNRDYALESVIGLYPDQEILDIFESAITHSNELMKTEEYAMSLIILAHGYRPSDVDEELATVEITPADMALSPSAKIARGTEMLYDEAYNEAKGQIDDELESIWQIVSEKTYTSRNQVSEQLRSAIFWQRVLIVLLIIAIILTFLIIMLLVVRPLRIHVKNVEKDERLAQIGAYEFKYLAMIYNEIYDLKLANEHYLEEKAQHDPLTGALNRRAFDKAVEGLREQSVPVCIMMIDVDNFKHINDQYGHAMGDKVLCMLAELLESRFRVTDIVARLGGDEFAVIAVNLPFADIDIMRLKIEGISERLSNPRGGIPPVSISVGCAYSEHGFKDGLTEQADQAMYRVKQNGRNGFEVFQ